MANGKPSVEQTLGNLCLLADTIPSHDSDKIDFGDFAAADALRAQPPDESEADEMALTKAPGPLPKPASPVKPGSEEAFYLLATYCFDLQRKMEYLFKAARAFGLKGDPALARDLLNDERTINAPGLTWKQRALRAEARMLELQREISRDHLALLREVARREK